MKTFAKLTLMGAIFPLLAATASAQDFYDDDIYGSSAARKAAAKKQQQRTSTQTVVTDFAPADRYAGVATTYGGSTRNVDEYNRRGSYTPVKTQTSIPDSLGNNFEYTRRLERFHNSDVVSRSNDPDVEYMYNYADDELAQSNGTVTPAEVNIYVNNVVDPWDVFSPYYYSSAWSWAFVPGYASPWWGYNYWGPTWSWSWNWGPSWSWDWGWGPGWGPSWSWGWGGGGWYPPHHHPMPGPSWSHNGRPGAAPGAYRPANRPVGSLTQGRPSSVGRPGRSSGTFTRRPSQASASDRVSGSATTNNGGFSRRPYNPSDANRVGALSNGNGGTRRSSATGSRTTTGRSSSSWGTSSGSSNRSSSSGSSSNRSSSSGYNRSSSGSSSGFNRSSGTGGSGRSSSSGSRSTSGGSRGRR